MSCKHGNWEPCDECAAENAEYEKAFDEGKKSGWEACESCHGIVDGKVMAVAEQRVEIADLKRQLEESQAIEARLREALFDVAHCLRGNQIGYDHELFDAAIALPHDDTAILEYRDAVIVQFVGEFKRHVGGDGEIWLHELEDFYDNKKAP